MRKIHLYVGVFISPALLFFAFTGALQSINLHETTQGSSFRPPAWLAELAQVHKKQTIVMPVRKPRSPEADRPTGDAPKGRQGEAGTGQSGQSGQSAAKVPEAAVARQKNHMPMKIFFVLVSLGLFVSTLTGIYMSYRYSNSKLLMTGLLIVGIVVPLALLPF